MMPQETNRMFGFKFEKSALEITDAAKRKKAELLMKIEERQVRLKALREEHGIDDAALIQLLTAARRAQQNNDGGSMSYHYNKSSTSSDGKSKLEESSIGAGVVNHLLTENDYIEAERASIKRLEFVIRNLRPLQRVTANGVKYEDNGFGLSYDELEFLGF